MKSIARISVVVIAAALSGCQAMGQSGTQTIALSINPISAQCDAYEHGERVGSYDPAQHSIVVPISMGGLEIVCSAAGYKDKRVSLVPDNSSAGFLGKVLTDYGPANHAYLYPVSIMITMESQNGTPHWFSCQAQ